MKKKYISPTINVVTIEGLGGFMVASVMNNPTVNNGGFEPVNDGEDMENQRQLGKRRFEDDW